jgi:hypothetical protein
MVRSAPLAIVSILALGGCATTPPLTTSVTGAVPAGRSFVPVAAGKYYGGGDLPVAPVAACLGRLGVSEVKVAGDLVLQLGSTLRPARSRVIVGEPAPGAPRPRRQPDRQAEELVMTLSDAGSGALVLRASARRVLGRGVSVAPADTVLADALCAAISFPAAAPSR